MLRCLSAVLAALVISAGALAAQDAPAGVAKGDFHLFLLAGQSNMAGRGAVGAEDQTPVPRVLVLGRDGRWKPALDPLHFDKKTAGVGPGRRFGTVVAAANPAITVGLIPAAVGGSPIASWIPGARWEQTKSHPYDDALSRARLAMRHGTLKAILWHQGESDCNPAAAATYRRDLTELAARLRKDLGLPNLPLLIGQLGKLPGSEWSAERREVDAAQRAVAAADPAGGFVSAENLSFNPDRVHFDAASQREFGRRYAEAYLALTVKK
jgi:hypothetical protein